jgi:hypothetical protein
MSAATLPVILNNYVRKDDRVSNIFDFERIVPVGDVPDWYEQRLNKWGTKWTGYDLVIGESAIDFFTAWSPPVPVIRKLAELHRDLVFRLEYYGCGRGEVPCHGIGAVLDGALTSDEAIKAAKLEWLVEQSPV